MNLYKPSKIWYVDFDFCKDFKDILLIKNSINLDDMMLEIEDNEPTKFFMSRCKFNKYFRKVLLEKFGV